MTSEGFVQGEGNYIRWRVDQFWFRLTHCDDSRHLIAMRKDCL